METRHRGAQTAPDPGGQTMYALRPRGQEATVIIDMVYDELVDAILDGRLTPGFRLVPDALARQLAVSTTPVKLALARLAAQGIVAEFPRRGMFVTKPDPEGLKALFAARLLLETAALREYGHRATGETVQRLSEVANQYRRLAEAGGPQSRRQIADTDRMFHRTIVQLTGNEHVLRWYDQTNIHLQAYRLANPQTRYAAGVREHDEIVEAFRLGDMERAERALRIHIESASNFALQAQVKADAPVLRPVDSRHRRARSSE